MMRDLFVPWPKITAPKTPLYLLNEQADKQRSQLARKELDEHRERIRERHPELAISELRERGCTGCDHPDCCMRLGMEKVLRQQEELQQEQQAPTEKALAKVNEPEPEPVQEAPYVRDGPFRFMDLPKDVRLMVYDEYVDSLPARTLLLLPAYACHVTSWTPETKNFGTALSLYGGCRVVHEEMETVVRKHRLAMRFRIDEDYVQAEKDVEALQRGLPRHAYAEPDDGEGESQLRLPKEIEVASFPSEDFGKAVERVAWPLLKMMRAHQLAVGKLSPPVQLVLMTDEGKRLAVDFESTPLVTSPSVRVTVMEVDGEAGVQRVLVRHGPVASGRYGGEVVTSAEFCVKVG